MKTAVYDQSQFKADAEKEEQKAARYQKQMICLSRGKRCADCDGADVYGDRCKWWRGKNERQTVSVGS